MEKSIDIKSAKKAIEVIEAFDALEEIKAFIEGEERPTVLEVAEKRIAAFKVPVPEEPVIPETPEVPETPVVVPETETASAFAPSAPSPSTSDEIAQGDTCRYHATEQPRMFKFGETIPSGWEDSPTKIPNFPWRVNFYTQQWEKKP